ncbi:MAG: hypothetical protein Q9208_003650 [Pyrenodesmia sp. 3 TL-2023]
MANAAISLHSMDTKSRRAGPDGEIFLLPPPSPKKITKQRTNIVLATTDWENMTKNSQNDGNTITLSQLNEHKTQQDLWIAVHGKVYNLTSFADDHPGGIDVLKDCAGTDGSETYEYAGHSANNMKTMQRFLVGTLAGYNNVPDLAPAADVPPGEGEGSPHDSSSGSGAAKTGRNGGSSSGGRKSAQSSSSNTLAVVMSLKKTWARLSSLLLTTVVSVGVFAGLSYWSFPTTGAEEKRIPDGGGIMIGSSKWAASHAFLEGLLLASSLSCAIFAVLYRLFSQTLEHERDVFSYPAVITRRV